MKSKFSIEGMVRGVQHFKGYVNVRLHYKDSDAPPKSPVILNEMTISVLKSTYESSKQLIQPGNVLRISGSILNVWSTKRNEEDISLMGDKVELLKAVPGRNSLHIIEGLDAQWEDPLAEALASKLFSTLGVKPLKD